MSDDMYKNYKFKVEKNPSKKLIESYHSIKISYKKIDNESILTSTNGGGNYSLYLQDRFLNFEVDNETKRISSFEGNLTFKEIKYKKIDLPSNFEDSILLLDTNDELFAGSGSYIPFDNNEILFDKTQKILQIGNINNDAIVYKIFSNCYIQLSQNKLVGLIFTEIDII